MTFSDSLVGQQIGQYKILSRIGQGGMAEVYKGIHLILNRHVAIKVLGRHLETDPKVTARFQREAQAVATLRHPNIVQIYDFGRHEGGYYMVMEYVEGTDLRVELEQRRREGAPFSPQQIVHVAEQLASALDYAHIEGVIHRDVKPGNVLLNTRGDAILSDFGLAMLRDRLSQVTMGHAFGTPEYIAPEQAMDSRAATPQSDIYSLGGILYEMITGELPFEADSAISLALKHINEEPPSLRGFVPDLPVAVENVVLKALAKEPQQRYHSGEALVAALRQAWSDEDVEETLVVASGRDQTPVPMPVSTPRPDGETPAVEPEPSTSAPVAAGPVSPPPAPPDDEPASPFWKRPWFLPVMIVCVLLGILLGLLAVRNRAASRFGLGATASPTPTWTMTPTVEPTATATVQPTAMETEQADAAGVTPVASPSPSRTATASPSPSLTTTPSPTATPTDTSTATPTSTHTPTPTPTLAPGEALTRSVDGMVMRFVPASAFLMGADDDDPDASDDEQPQHSVLLGDYWMDETEVTVTQYKQCVAADGCEAPYTRTYYDNPTYTDHPMTFISWEQSADYCRWLAAETGWDVQLPTEAQWEKAASWDPFQETKYRYPWGDELETDHVQLGRTTTAVGGYPQGASPYGILDLSGNVWEWTADWYDKDVYMGRDGARDPVGPDDGIYRVMRGGSYGSTANYDRQLRTTHREVGYPESTAERPAKGADLGFRCIVVGERLTTEGP